MPVPIASRWASPASSSVGVGDEIVWDVQGLAVPSRVACLREVELGALRAQLLRRSFPRARSTGRRRPTWCCRGSRTPPGARRLQRAIVDAHPNVSTLDLAQVQRTVEGVLDKVVLAIRFMALFSLAAGALVLAGAVAASR